VLSASFPVRITTVTFTCFLISDANELTGDVVCFNGVAFRKQKISRFIGCKRSELLTRVQCVSLTDGAGLQRSDRRVYGTEETGFQEEEKITLCERERTSPVFHSASSVSMITTKHTHTHTLAVFTGDSKAGLVHSSSVNVELCCDISSLVMNNAVLHVTSFPHQTGGPMRVRL